MRINAGWLAVGTFVAVSAMGIGMLPVRVSGSDDAAVRAEILKLADAIADNDAEGSKKQADSVAAKFELADIMALLRLRARKGLGVGPTPGTIKPDGIEAKLMALGKRAPTPKEAGAEGKDVAQAAFVTAAIAEIAIRKPPVDKKEGEKDPKDWRTWSEDMRKHAEELGKAAKAGKSMEVKAAATKLNSACNSCHGVFRDS